MTKEIQVAITRRDDTVLAHMFVIAKSRLARDKRNGLKALKARLRS